MEKNKIIKSNKVDKMRVLIMEEEIEALLNGDLSKFTSFYEKTKRNVYYNIYAILKDYALSEDVLQETYVKFLENLPKLKKGQNALGYLYVISRNLALDTIRKRKNESQEEIYDHMLKQEESHLSNDILDLAERVLKKQEFEIVILHLVNEMPHKEIAKLMHRPLGTILWAYNNALKKLRKEVGLDE